MRAAAKFFGGILAGVVTINCCLGVVRAQTPPTVSKNGITVAPTKQDITLGPGLIEAHTTITLTNNTSFVFNGSLKLADFKTIDERGNLTLEQAQAPGTKYGLANWLTLPAGIQVSLLPGQTSTIPVTIDNRSDLTPGGHYGAVIVSASLLGSTSNINLNQQIVSLIFAKKIGGIRPAMILDYITTQPSHGLPNVISLHFRNIGNVYLVPRGYVELTDPNGKLISKGIINEESNILLQDSSRQFISLMRTVSSSSVAGRYTMTAHFRFDGQDSFDTKTVYFSRGSAFPLTGIITGIVVTLGIGSYFVIRYRWR